MKKKIDIKTAFLIVFFSFLCAFLAGGILAWLGTFYAQSYQKMMTFISFIVGQSIMVVPLFFYLKIKNIPIQESIRFNALRSTTVWYVILFSMGLVILSDELDKLIQVFISTPEYIVDLNQLLKPKSFFDGFLLVIAVVILAPLGEEIVFRGFLQRILEKQWRDPTRAVLFTALIFAFIHMNPYWFFQIYILGIFLGFLALKTNSIIAPIILHGLNNFIALLLSFSDSNDDSFYLWKGHVSPWILIFSLFSVVIGFKYINQKNLN